MLECVPSSWRSYSQVPGQISRHTGLEVQTVPHLSLIPTNKQKAKEALDWDRLCNQSFSRSKREKQKTKNHRHYSECFLELSVFNLKLFYFEIMTLQVFLVVNCLLREIQKLEKYKYGFEVTVGCSAEWLSLTF